MTKAIGNRLWVVSILIAAVLSIAPSATAQQMSTPIRQVTDKEANEMLPGRMPKWEQGYLVAWRMESYPSDTNENVAVYDRDGKLVGKTRIWVPDASFLHIEDAAVRKDGNVAAVGWAMTNSGTIAGFLADVAVTRNSGRIIQTAPFEGMAVGFGPDGTIWVLGKVVGPGRGREPAPDHYMVQHFGADDVLKDQRFLLSEFSCEFARQFGRSLPKVVASDDRIGFFAPTCRTWLELSPAGELLGKWTWSAKSPVVNGVEKTEITTVALTSANELYGQRDWPKAGLLFRFDRPSSEWVPVDTDATASAVAPLYRLEGSDGDVLVYHSSDKRLVWSKVVKSE